LKVLKANVRKEKLVGNRVEVEEDLLFGIRKTPTNAKSFSFFNTG
jgi:hypothetical protein